MAQKGAPLFLTAMFPHHAVAAHPDTSAAWDYLYFFRTRTIFGSLPVQVIFIFFIQPHNTGQQVHCSIIQWVVSSTKIGSRSRRMRTIYQIDLFFNSPQPASAIIITLYPLSLTDLYGLYQQDLFHSIHQLRRMRLVSSSMLFLCVISCQTLVLSTACSPTRVPIPYFMSILLSSNNPVPDGFIVK